MLDNPLKIDPGTVFICGPGKKNPFAINEDFEKLELRLTELGYKVFNPVSIKQKDKEGSLFLSCSDLGGLSDKEELACMVMCKSIVTLPNWEVDRKCDKQVKVARILSMEVMPSEKFYYIDKFHSER